MLSVPSIWSIIPTKLFLTPTNQCRAAGLLWDATGALLPKYLLPTEMIAHKVGKSEIPWISFDSLTGTMSLSEVGGNQFLWGEGLCDLLLVVDWWLCL